MTGEDLYQVQLITIKHSPPPQTSWSFLADEASVVLLLLQMLGLDKSASQVSQ